MLDGTIAGLINGVSTAILAVCLVALYRFSGVMNLAQGAIAALGAFTVYGLLDSAVPLPLAVLGGLLCGGAVAAGTGWVFARWFAAATPSARTAAAAVLLVLFLTLGYRLFGDSPRVMPALVPDVTVAIAGVRVSLTSLVAIAVGVIGAALVAWILRATQLGLRLQALAVNPTSVQLLGINTRRLTIGVWASVGVISTLALLLVAPTRNPTFASATLLVVPALAAAILGGATRVWVALWAGLILGALEGALSRVDGFAAVRTAIPLLVVAAALIWMRRREVWDVTR